MSKSVVALRDGDVFAKQWIEMIAHDSWDKFLIVGKCSPQHQHRVFLLGVFDRVFPFLRISSDIRRSTLFSELPDRTAGKN